MTRSSVRSTPSILRQLRILLILFIAGLVLSGVTAFPLESELQQLVKVLQWRPLLRFPGHEELSRWITQVHIGLAATNRQYPFLAYGTDWLAFAHLVIAMVFIGPYRDPVRNKWVIDFGLMACAAVPFLALIAGPVRGVPFGWRLIDCSFGVFGAIPLLRCRYLIKQLEQKAY